MTSSHLSEALYQLSYSPNRKKEEGLLLESLKTRGGLEPTPSAHGGRATNYTIKSDFSHAASETAAAILVSIFSY